MMTDMKEIILCKISHPYLQQYIQTPNIDNDKLLLLISMLESNGCSKLEMEDFVVTTMLIQIALDTHERVPNSTVDHINETNLKPTQLTVLAGIYYSSLYYKILSNTDNLSMIRVLSEGIKDVNEHKILYYQSDFDGIEKLMNSVMTIESALISKVADYLNESFWKEWSGHFLLIKRLLLEKNFFIQEGSSQLFEALRRISFPTLNQQIKLSAEQKNYLLSICDNYIDYSRKLINEGILRNPSMNDNVLKSWKNLLLPQAPVM
jgi:heptaprenyl diphosphate synthase